MLRRNEPSLRFSKATKPVERRHSRVSNSGLTVKLANASGGVFVTGVLFLTAVLTPCKVNRGADGLENWSPTPSESSGTPRTYGCSPNTPTALPIEVAGLSNLAVGFAYRQAHTEPDSRPVPRESGK